MVGWHHRNNELEFEQTLGNTEGQAILAGYSSWSSRVRHDLMTEQQLFYILDCILCVWLGCLPLFFNFIVNFFSQLVEITFCLYVLSHSVLSYSLQPHE